jgi:23S rRNA (uracil1939-C5)-methyltransferase
VTEATLTVERIGARGDGVARHEGKPIFLPFTVPGDVVRARVGRDGEAKLVALLSRSARQVPPCPHFGVCGGCSLQHLPDIAYAEAKRDFVRAALAHRGLDETLVAPIERVPPATRRRARVAMTRSAIGFYERASHRIIGVTACPVLHPALFAVVMRLRSLALEATASLTLADTGIDLLLELPEKPDLSALETLAKFAHDQDLARLSWRTKGELATPVVQRRPVQMNFSGVTADLPPDCFLQATKESETKIRALVLVGVGDARTVADLYAGVGTFSFALAKNAKVHAIDRDAAAIAALGRAGAEISTEIRNLEKRPLLKHELDNFDAVTFDPPYAGAAAQTKEMARSIVKRIVAVSCNPASFARDARTLVDGGYRLACVVPVDQFLWSAEIELVAHFVRQ